MSIAEASVLASASRELLSKGDAVGAERVLAPVFNELRADPAVLHLMGLIKRAQNQLEEAERHLRSAVAYSLNEAAYYNDLGVVLQARGVYEEAIRVFRASLALLPQADATRANLIHCLIAAGALKDAEAEAHTFTKTAPGPESWTLLAQVHRNQERYPEALAAAETALKYGPRLRGLRYNHALALDQVGRSAEALEGYETLARQQLDTPDLALNFARALYSSGRKKDAEAIAERGVTQWPSVTALHSVLARMRWLRGERENCTAITEAAMQQRPNDLGLRLACADALHRGGHLQKALNVLDEALRRAPDTPALLTAMGVVLDELDRPVDGLRLLRRVAELSPNSRHAQRNLLSTLIRAGCAEEALQLARRLLRDDPDEQFLIASETTALRVLGDPAYRDLCDYARFVRTYEISPPRNFFTIESFNAAFAEFLRGQHRSTAHPLDQYMPHGGQTGRNLLALDEPLVKHFLSSVDAAVRDYIDRLSADDPVGRRRSKQSRYSTLWSVRLENGGYLPNHVHDRGWISSAYFAACTPSERPKDQHAGWLKLGEPNRPPAGCGPEQWIEPKPGTLVLFPSYMWHGTVPFEGAERLSASFDVIPR